MPNLHGQASAIKDPRQLISVWRQERAFRVSKTLCYAGVVLAIVATIADYFWSDVLVILTDFVLLIGCGITFYWLQAAKRVQLYWLPMFLGFWISSLPSYYSTGGLASPFFGVGLAALLRWARLWILKTARMGLWFLRVCTYRHFFCWTCFTPFYSILCFH